MRLIDADALKDVIGISKRLGNKAISYYIDTMPTIDAEPVVRCKDCKYNGHGYCNEVMDGRVRGDWFCASGEKMDEVNNETK